MFPIEHIERMTCWSCIHYRIGGSDFLEAYCVQGLTGFPYLGDDCPGFIYEPGADESEKDEKYKSNMEAGRRKAK